MKRREVLRMIGTGLAAAPFLSVFGCDDSAAGGDGGSTDSSAANDTSASADGSKRKWAIGGTADLWQATKDLDPFSGSVSSCLITCAMTLGPCYAPTRVARDISDGLAGVPTRFALRLLDESCLPITDASVDIWHVMPAGTYSGEAANLGFCLGGNNSLAQHEYFRGVQYTDANGRVDFYSCYPGWYSSRTVHVHLTIRRGANTDYTQQTEYLTTQLFFDDSISDDVFANAAPYARSTQRDTNNTDDTVIAASAVSHYLFDQAAQPDGSLVCAKTLILRSSTAESLCSAPGGSGGPGDGGMGPPPGGGGPPA